MSRQTTQPDPQPPVAFGRPAARQANSDEGLTPKQAWWAGHEAGKKEADAQNASDAARYRWLRDGWGRTSNRMPHITQYPAQQFDKPRMPQISDVGMDAAIDAAMKWVARAALAQQPAVADHACAATGVVDHGVAAPAAAQPDPRIERMLAALRRVDADWTDAHGAPYEVGEMPALDEVRAILAGSPPSATTADTWPCARITVDEAGKVVSGELYAPGLPAGTHDVYPVVVYEGAAAPAGEQPRKECPDCHIPGGCVIGQCSIGCFRSSLAGTTGESK